MASYKRNSNIEILRIVAMLMILILHVDYYALGEPTTFEAISNPLQTFSKVFFEMFSLISVNLFVLRSGWFTIKVTLKGLFKFIFQCTFIMTLMYAIGIIIGATELSLNGLLECVFMSNNAWFVKSYIGLYILAPALNIYTEKASKKQLLTTLIIFYSFQTLYGCLYYSASFIIFGCSTFSFVGLYLLARYFRMYCDNLYKYGLWIWLSSLIIAIIWTWLPLISGHLAISYMAMHYSSPSTIIGALGLLIWAASKTPKYNKFINWIAASCFSVYLYHICNTWTSDLFKNTAQCIFTEYSGLIYMCVISGFILAVFTGGILIDQIRILFWKILNYLEKAISSSFSHMYSTK